MTFLKPEEQGVVVELEESRFFLLFWWKKTVRLKGDALSVRRALARFMGFSLEEGEE